MIKAKEIRFQNSETILAQGERQIRDCKQRGFYAKRGGNGTYIMVKNSEVYLTFEDENGKIHTESVREAIKESYPISRVTKQVSYKFLEDVKNGNIKLSYSEKEGVKPI